MHGTLQSARTARVSQQDLHKNCPQVVEKDQWPPNSSPDLNRIKISCMGSDARSVFETFIQSPKQFLN